MVGFHHFTEGRRFSRFVGYQFTCFHGFINVIHHQEGANQEEGAAQ